MLYVEVLTQPQPRGAAAAVAVPGPAGKAAAPEAALAQGGAAGVASPEAHAVTGLASPALRPENSEDRLTLQQLQDQIMSKHLSQLGSQPGSHEQQQQQQQEQRQQAGGAMPSPFGDGAAATAAGGAPPHPGRPPVPRSTSGLSSSFSASALSPSRTGAGPFLPSATMTGGLSVPLPGIPAASAGGMHEGLGVAAGGSISGALDRNSASSYSSMTSLVIPSRSRSTVDLTVMAGGRASPTAAAAAAAAATGRGYASHSVLMEEAAQGGGLSARTSNPNLLALAGAAGAGGSMERGGWRSVGGSQQVLSGADYEAWVRSTGGETSEGSPSPGPPAPPVIDAAAATISSAGGAVALPASGSSSSYAPGPGPASAASPATPPAAAVAPAAAASPRDDPQPSPPPAAPSIQRPAVPVAAPEGGVSPGPGAPPHSASPPAAPAAAAGSKSGGHISSWLLWRKESSDGPSTRGSLDPPGSLRDSAPQDPRASRESPRGVPAPQSTVSNHSGGGSGQQFPHGEGSGPLNPHVHPNLPTVAGSQASASQAGGSVGAASFTTGGPGSAGRKANSSSGGGGGGNKLSGVVRSFCFAGEPDGPLGILEASASPVLPEGSGQFDPSGLLTSPTAGGGERDPAASPGLMGRFSAQAAAAGGSHSQSLTTTPVGSDLFRRLSQQQRPQQPLRPHSAPRVSDPAGARTPGGGHARPPGRVSSGGLPSGPLQPLSESEVQELIQGGYMSPPPKETPSAQQLSDRMAHVLASLRGDAPLVRLRIQVLPEASALTAAGAAAAAAAAAAASDDFGLIGIKTVGGVDHLGGFSAVRACMCVCVRGV
jgi:hypothetical protein